MGPATRREEWGLIAAGSLLVAGVFSDGYAHATLLEELESFFTPWHAVIFAGYLACVGVVFLTVRSRFPDAGSIREALPGGWSLTLLGIALFAVGFLGDGFWHTIYGIEADLEALLSPTHLLMLVGGLCIFSTPIVGPWMHDSRQRVPGPALAGAALVQLAMSFFLTWTWPINYAYPLSGFASFIRPAGEFPGFMGQALGVLGYIVAAILFVSVPLFLARRWSLPGYTMLVLIGVPTYAQFVFETDGWKRTFAFVVAAAVGDLVLRRRPPSAERPFGARLLGVVVPLVAIALDLVAVEFFWGLGWPPESIAGSAVLGALTGLGISLLVFPPALPTPSGRRSLP